MLALCGGGSFALLQILFDMDGVMTGCRPVCSWATSIDAESCGRH